MNIEFNKILEVQSDHLSSLSHVLVTDTKNWAIAYWTGLSWSGVDCKDAVLGGSLSFVPIYFAEIPEWPVVSTDPCLDPPAPRELSEEAGKRPLSMEYVQGIVDCANLINKKVEYQK